MENVTKLVETYRYALSLDLMANQVITGCGFLWINYDSAVTAGGELLVFGTYDLEIRIAENYQNMAHHYIRYRTESFREWLLIPGVTAAAAERVKAEVQVAGAACEAGGETITVSLEVQAVIHLPAPETSLPAGEERRPVDHSATAPPAPPKAGLFGELEALRAYIKRQGLVKVEVLSLNGVQVITDENTDNEKK